MTSKQWGNFIGGVYVYYSSGHGDTLAVALALAMVAGVAKAEESKHDNVSNSVADKTAGGYEASSGDLAALEADLRLVFEVYLKATDQGWIVNDVAAAEADGVSRYDLAAISDSFNRASTPFGETAPQHRFGSKAWAKCVINFVFPGATDGFIGGGIISWLAKGKYAQVASYLLRVVGPAALKGGGVGLVAALATAVGWCSTPWAS